MKAKRKVIYQTSFGRHWRVYAIGEETEGTDFFHFWLEETRYGYMTFMFGTYVENEEQFLEYAEQATGFCKMHLQDLAIIEEAREEGR